MVLAAAGLGHAADDAAALGAGWINAASSSASSTTSSPTSPPTSPAPAPAPALAYRWPTIALPAASVWPANAPLRLGVITSPLDDDGVLRRLPLWHQVGGRHWPLLSLAVADAVPPPAPSPPPLLDAQGRLHMAFPTRQAWPPVRAFSELALAALGQHDSTALHAAVQGRAVFIGSSALLADAVMTVNGQAPGTVALAQTYSALQNGTWVRPPAAWAGAALLLLGLLPAGASVWRGRPAPRQDLALAALALLLGAGLSLAWLSSLRMAMPWAAPLAAMAAGLAASLFIHQRQQQAAQRALAHALAVAAEAGKAKSQFLANVSHEIRTPLNALLGVAELLASSPLSAQQQRHVQVFRDAGQALHSLINDLLDLSKIEAGHFELDLAAFSLHQLLERMAALMQPRAQEKGLSLKLELAPGLPDGVWGDRKRLEQGLLNLLGNAIKFTTQGGVRLHAGPDDREPGTLCFEVVDTGIGIAPSKLDAIFEPFAQADGSVTRHYGGTGLGLAITRNVAQLMGGSVQVRSNPGVGSVFTLRLPLPRSELPAAEPSHPAVVAAGAQQPLSVLLAEDNEVNVYIFSAMVQAQPITLDLAANGLVALDMLRRRRYDLAFIDIQMPGLDGLGVTRELRQLEARSGRLRTPVVALTANAFASDVQDSHDAGCDHHLPKPVSQAQLLGALAQFALVDPLDAAGFGTASSRMFSVAAAAAAPVLDRAAAVECMGGDAALYRRIAEHAAVFIEAWPKSFDAACTEPNPDRAWRLAHDLKGIAGTLGAGALAQAAAALEASLDLRIAPPAPDTAALLQVHEAIVPVLVALSQGASHAVP